MPKSEIKVPSVIVLVFLGALALSAYWNLDTLTWAGVIFFGLPAVVFGLFIIVKMMDSKREYFLPRDIGMWAAAVYAAISGYLCYISYNATDDLIRLSFYVSLIGGVLATVYFLMAATKN